MSSTPLFFDRVMETSTTTGTGSYTLAGAIDGYQLFAVVGNSNSCYYCAADVDANGSPVGDWEVGIGTYTASGTTLSRDVIQASSNAGAAVDWAAGTRRVFLVVSAAYMSSTVAAASGFYKGTGHPQGVVSAALGAQYVDANTGYLYRKFGGGSTVWGWYCEPTPGMMPGPQGFVANLSNATTTGQAFGANGYGPFWPNVGIALFTQTLTGASSRIVIGGKPFASFATSGTNGTASHIVTASSNGELFLDDDLDVWAVINTDPTAVTNTRIWFGFTTAFMTDTVSAPASASSYGALMIRYLSDGNGVWEGTTRTTTASDVTASLGSLAAATQYKLRIRFIRQGGTPTAYFSVNDGAELSLTTKILGTGSTAFLTLGIDQPAGGVAKAIRWHMFGGTVGS